MQRERSTLWFGERDGFRVWVVQHLAGEGDDSVVVAEISDIIISLNLPSNTASQSCYALYV